MKSSAFAIHVCNQLEAKTGVPVTLEEVHAEFGGSINESFCLHTSIGKFFLKRNNNPDFSHLFHAEATGLEILASNSSFKIPKVFCVGTFKEHTYLVTEYLEKENYQNGFWKNFGHSLAQMHKQSAIQFGLSTDNFIGKLYQSNTFKESWADFFVGERIVPMVSLAHEKGKLDLEMVKQFEQLCFKIPQLFPHEPAALLHGDLWSGNYLCTTGNVPAVFDPSVYYGHREMDIAMMHLFGGFHTDVFKAYHEIYPLENDWKSRIPLCNLYPLLVHVNLFGGNYIRQVKQILNTFL